MQAEIARALTALALPVIIAAAIYGVIALASLVMPAPRQAHALLVMDRLAIFADIVRPRVVVRVRGRTSGRSENDGYAGQAGPRVGRRAQADVRSVVGRRAV